MNRIRKAVVAGTFYPEGRETLERTLRTLFEGAAGAPGEAIAARALIAPHAGYIYSGPIAASAYRILAALRGTISRIVLLGPSHRVRFEGLALPGADSFETPLGLVSVDRDLRDRVLALPQVREFPEAHSREHSLEVQVPFLQEALGEFTLLPLALGRVSAEDAAEVLEAVWDEPGVFTVVSSDLSHYLSYEEARRRDESTSRAIEELAPERITPEDACGVYALAGLLTLARKRGLRARTLDLRNSGDTAGDRSRVVGYGAYIIE